MEIDPLDWGGKTKKKIYPTPIPELLKFNSIKKKKKSVNSMIVFNQSAQFVNSLANLEISLILIKETQLASNKKNIFRSVNFS